jgi:hypothetical protein
MHIVSLQHKQRRARSGLVLALCLPIALLLAGCGGGSIRGKIENGIAKGMQKRIGPAKSYKVTVTGPTMALVSGKLKGIDIVGSNVHTSKGIVVQTLHVNISDLVVDTGTQEMKRCGKTTYEATLSERELERYLLKLYPDVPELGLELQPRFARVRAKPGVSIAKVPVLVDASIDVQSHRRLLLNLQELDVAGIPVPSFVRNYLERKVNPVLDVDDLGMSAQVDSVHIDKGSITLAGSLDLIEAAGGPPAPARQPSSWER